MASILPPPAAVRLQGNAPGLLMEISTNSNGG
jgi:hypothetical protein